MAVLFAGNTGPFWAILPSDWYHVGMVLNQFGVQFGSPWVTFGSFWDRVGITGCRLTTFFSHLVLMFPAVLAIFVVFKVFTAILSLFSGVSQLSMQI